MRDLGNVLIVIFNGLVELFGFATSVFAVASAAVIAGMLWMAVLEDDELTTQSAKPDVELF